MMQIRIKGNFIDNKANYKILFTIYLAYIKNYSVKTLFTIPFDLNKKTLDFH